MKYARILGITLGALLFLAGAGAVANSLINPVKTTGTWYLQVSGLILGGAAVSTASNKFLKETTKKEIIMPEEAKVVNVVTPIPEKEDNKDPMIHLDMIQLADYECLHHLTKRFSDAGDAEAVANCRKLQERMFELYYGQKSQMDKPVSS